MCHVHPCLLRRAVSDAGVAALAVVKKPSGEPALVDGRVGQLRCLDSVTPRQELQAVEPAHVAIWIDTGEPQGERKQVELVGFRH